MVNAYATAQWQNFFVAEVGAAAALTGLLFVAVSINLKQILSFPKLPAARRNPVPAAARRRRLQSPLARAKPPKPSASRSIACAGLMSLAVLLVQLRHGPDDPADPAWWFVSRIANVQLPALLFLAGGTTLTIRYGYGLYFMLAGTLTAFLGAVYNAWVLLVEIIRQHPDPQARLDDQTGNGRRPTRVGGKHQALTEALSMILDRRLPQAVALGPRIIRFCWLQLRCPPGRTPCTAEAANRVAGVLCRKMRIPVIPGSRRLEGGR